MRRVILILLAFGLSASQALPEASAEDPSPAQALLMRLEASRKDEDGAEWLHAVKQAPPIYTDATGSLRKKLMRELGKAFRKGTLLVKQDALKSIVATKDGDVAWKEGLRLSFPKAESKTEQTWDIEVLTALYQLRPDAAIDPLLHLMKKGKSPVLAAGACRVLGAYERSRRRVHVLESLAKIVLANAPGKSRKGSRGSDKFWAMATQLEATLNELTGQNLTLKQWGPVWKANKKKPAALFVEPLPKS